MIVKISRGGRMGGLMVYLAGPGRSNEHEAPHLVAGSDGVMAWWSTDVLGRSDALAIAELIEEPRNTYGTEVTAPVKEFSDEAGKFVATGARKDVHVWHCSLSLAPDQDALGDEKWEAIAQDFVDKMGFSQADGRAPARWAAVHHGASKNGGDHIHVAVSLVREDGTKVSTHLDYKRASSICNELEKAYGLEVVEGREVGRSARAESRAELERAGREAKASGRGTATVDTYSARVSRRVRACAVASTDEGEFVRRCRLEELWVKPRFAAGTQDVVVGYSVAERPEHGQSATWRAAGHLGRDLSLPRLRTGWEDSPTAAGEAAAEWQAAWRGKPPVTRGGREMAELDPVLWERYSVELGSMRERLAKIPVHDHDTWAAVARETSGAFAAWSLRLEPTPGPLAEASDTLARSAAIHKRNTTPGKTRHLSMRGPAQLLMALSVGTDSRAGQAIMLRQLMATLRMLHDVQRATDQARTAARLRTTATQSLTTVQKRLPKVTEVDVAVRTAGPAGPRGPQSPLPGKTAAAARRTARQDRSTGMER